MKKIEQNEITQLTFEYKNEYYSFNVSRYSLSSHLDVDYDKECRYESYDGENECDHDYGRCQVLRNIEKQKFKVFEYCKYAIAAIDSDKNKSLVIEKICRALKGIDVEDYIECSGESDYYGENLVKEVVNHSELVDRIITNLKLESLKNIKSV